jgi:hypothetical protein
MKMQSRKKMRFVVCVKNEGYQASLEPRKIYETLPDPKATERGFIRVIDESGEDYLYPEEYFVPIELSRNIERALSIST